MNNPMILASVKEDFYLNFIKDDRYLWLLDGLKTTLIITVFAVIVGLIIGFLVAIIRSAHDKSGSFKILNAICRVYLTVIRGTPTMIQLLIMYYIVFGSVDVSGKNIELDAGLKYYKNGVESAKQQAKSVFEAYKKYQSGGGKETLEEYLKNRNYQDDSVLNDAVYSGQIRVIPADQLTEATKWLERKIAEEGSKRPEQVERYRETLKLLKDRISDNHGNESIPLSEEDAKKLAQLAKEGKINPEE